MFFRHLLAVVFKLLLLDGLLAVAPGRSRTALFRTAAVVAALALTLTLTLGWALAVALARLGR